jgi:predicted acyl esterase
MTDVEPRVIPETCTLSDGTVLSLDRYAAPDSVDPRPVVLCCSPYLKGDARTIQSLSFPIDAIVAAGYDAVIADIRGTGASGGDYHHPLSPQEAQDGKELVEWLADQPYCDGQVALAGVSYSGGVQYNIAALRPRGLRCIVPGVGMTDFYRDWTHRGGIPQHPNWASLTFLQLNQPKRSIKPALDFYYGVAQATELDGPLFWERSPERVISKIEVPALVMMGHFDYFSRAGIRAFDRLNVPKRLVAGAWGHQYPDDPAEIIAWLDYWLRGIGEDPTAGENVRTWVIGREEWRTRVGRHRPAKYDRFGVVTTATELPVSATMKPWGQPAGAPRDPFDPTCSGMWLWGEASTFDLEVPEGTLVDGIPVVELTFALAGATDADINLRLNVVDVEGTTHQVTEGRLRLSHREIDASNSDALESGEIELVHRPHTSLTPVSEGEKVTTLVELSPTCIEVMPGSRLQLGVSLRRNDGQSVTNGRLELDPSTVVCLPVDRR